MKLLLIYFYVQDKSFIKSDLLLEIWLDSVGYY